MRDDTEYLYKTTDYYAPQYEHCIRWDDPTLGIEWPMTQAPILSGKDQQGLAFSQAEVFEN
jgi:dTDP-4-dehydrorhamnose 3,5-epimerase